MRQLSQKGSRVQQQNDCCVAYRYGIKGVVCEIQHRHTFQYSSGTLVFLVKNVLKLKRSGLSDEHFEMLLFLLHCFDKYLFFVLSWRHLLFCWCHLLTCWYFLSWPEKSIVLNLHSNILSEIRFCDLCFSAGPTRDQLLCGRRKPQANN